MKLNLIIYKTVTPQIPVSYGLSLFVIHKDLQGGERELPFSLEKKFNENILLLGPRVFSIASECVRGTWLPG